MGQRNGRGHLIVGVVCPVVMPLPVVMVFATLLAALVVLAGKDALQLRVDAFSPIRSQLA